LKKNNFIDRIKLKNYRCHPDGDMGPFARFNLIYGRNGSGKTSFLEAIELALTGHIFRLESKDDLINVVARNRKKHISVSAFLNGKETATFRDYGNFPSLKNMIWSLYKIKAEGRKARFLLPHMFETHNILYSEQIVQFLTAGEKGKLNEVLSELILGREVMNTWRYLEEGKNKISYFIRDFQSELKNKRKEINEINKVISELRVEDATRLQSLGEELNKSLPLVFWPMSTPPEWKPTSGCLISLRKAMAKIEEVLKHVKYLTSFIEIREKLPKWSYFKERLEEIKSTRKSLETELQSSRGKRDSEADKLTSLEKEEQEVNSLYKQVQKKLKGLSDIEQKVKTLLNWMPELISWEKESNIRGLIKNNEINIKNWGLALVMFERLPDVQTLRLLDKKILIYQQEQRKFLTSLEKNNKRNENLSKRLIEVQQVLAKVENRQKRLTNSIKGLHSHLDEVFKLHPTNICPACGKSWLSVEDLKKATRKQLKTILAEFDIGINKKHDEMILKTRLESELADLDEEINLDNINLNQIDKQLKKYLKQKQQVEALWNELKILLNKLEYPLIKQKDMINQIESLDKNQFNSNRKDLRNDLANKETKLRKIWSGLREDEFKDKVNELQNYIWYLKPILKDINIVAPDELRIDLWKELFRNLRKKQNEEQKEFTIIQKQLQEIIEKKGESVRICKKNERQIIAIKDNIQEVDKKFQDWSDAQKRIESLMRWELISKSEKVNIKILSENINRLNRQTIALLSELEFQIKAKKQLSSMEKRLKDLINKKKLVENYLGKSEEFFNRMEKLNAPEIYEENVWDEYANIISFIFKKLHWPPDYSGVYLKREDKNLDLKVAIRKEKDILKSAHEWLSSGQRTALALSVFWSLNSVSENIPPLLLMDEPIQSIDDLNMLNFLDGLRWLAECVNRQVFITTASKRVAGLIRRKFSYLQDDFLEMQLMRDEGLTIIKYFDWNEEVINNSLLSERARDQ